MFDILEADIVVMQETKIQRKDLRDDMVLVPGWDVYFSLPKHKKGDLSTPSEMACITDRLPGYSGVAIYTRNSTCCPIRAEEGITGVLCPPNSSTKFRDLPESEQIGGYPRAGQLPSDIDAATLDSEGRCVILEFPAFVLIGTYSPATRDSSRDDFRIGYLDALDVRVRNLVAAGKQVILTGDLNVIRSHVDTCNVLEMLRKEDSTVDEWMAMPSRRILNQLVFEGEVIGEKDEGREEPVMWDICRYFHPDRQGMFTCWDTKKNTRPANNGSRIDYVLCSAGLKNWASDSNIQEGLHGSDHCPVYVTFADTLGPENEEVHFLDGVNPPGMVEGGKRLREWSSKDLLPISAKLIPEFDRRRSIRDMFMKKSAPKSAATNTSGFPGIPDDIEHGPLSVLSRHVQDDGAQLVSSAIESVRPDEASTPAPSGAPNEGLTSRSEPTASAKRSAKTTSPSNRTFKKSKTAESQRSSNTDCGGKSQSSLASFFKPRASPNNEPSCVSFSGTKDTTNAKPASPSAAPNAVEPPPSVSLASPVVFESTEKVFDPIEAKESWSKLQLGQRVAPKCEHEEPCISLLTKKPGINCGKSYPFSAVLSMMSRMAAFRTTCPTSLDALLGLG